MITYLGAKVPCSACCSERKFHGPLHYNFCSWGWIGPWAKRLLFCHQMLILLLAYRVSIHMADHVSNVVIYQ